MSINNLNTYLNVRDAHLRVVSGNVYAQAMNIGGINVETAHGLQSVSDTGNVTSNTLQFSNATTGFVTTANVNIGRDLVVTGNATVSKELTVTSNAIVSSNLNVSDDLIVTNNILASNNLTVTGNLNVTTIMSDSNVVAEYTGPHDRPLRKYPEVAFPTQASGDIGDTTVTHKGYTLTSSTTYNFINHNLTNALDGLTSTAWSGNLGNYTTAGVPESTTRSGLGDYIQLELPNAIKIQHTKIFSQETAGYSNGPRDITLYGSNNGTDWTSIKVVTDLPLDGEALNTTVHVNSVTFYRYFRLEINKIWIDSGNATYPRIAEWELYGYEEGSGSLDTTLKSVYNVPATTGTQLEVYYDAKNYTSGTITDESPNTYVGTLNGNTQLETVDGIKAFTFDGNGDTITGTIPGISGEYVHSITFWIKFNDFSTANTGYTLFEMGARSQDDIIGLYAEPGKVNYYFYSNDNSYSLNGVSSGNLIHDQWYHFTATYSGGSDLSNRKLYINGNEIPRSTHGGASSGALTLANGNFSIGDIIGGTGLNDFAGSIANFRIYSKALNAEQIQELYDFQKDYFLGSKSQVTLYKGHLGVGVTEPSGQLELAGDERLQEYPPRDLGGFETMIEGEGTYKVSSSSDVPNPSVGSSDHPATAFTANDTFFRGVNSAYAFNTTVPATYTGTHFTNGVGGDFIQIELPHKIYLKSINITSRTNGSNYSDRAPHTGFIFGSNNGGTTWSQVASWTGLNWTLGESKPIQINSSVLYSTYRLVANELANTTGNASRFNINRWQLFGTPGPTTLDKGSLTLGRSLDVPRVSRYDVDTETPRPEKLVLDLDTTVNSSPTDISGKGNHGTFYNGAYYSAADKAFNFDGTDEYIEAVTNLGSGNQNVSFSMWINTHTASRWFTWLGSEATAGGMGMYRGSSTYKIVVRSGSNVEISAGPLNTWEHLVFTYDSSNVFKGYVNGEPGTVVTTVTDTVDVFSLAANPPIEIGARTTAGSERYFDGQISNFKLYNVALEPSEVRKLYNLGRTGRSMVISDTAVGIGKAPEAQLDVRGNLRVGGTIQFSLIISHRFITADTTVTNLNYTPFSGIIYETPSGLHNDNYFTCPIKGVYQCVANILTDNAGDYSGNHTWLVNGSETSPTSRGYALSGGGSNHKQATSHFYFELNAGDTVGVASAGTNIWYGSADHRHSAMSIRLITPT